MVWILCVREEKEGMVKEERGSDDWGERGWEGGWSGEGVREERMRKGMDGEK